MDGDDESWQSQVQQGTSPAQRYTYQKGDCRRELGNGIFNNLTSLTCWNAFKLIQACSDSFHLGVVARRQQEAYAEIKTKEKSRLLQFSIIGTCLAPVTGPSMGSHLPDEIFEKNWMSGSGSDESGTGAIEPA